MQKSRPVNLPLHCLYQIHLNTLPQEEPKSILQFHILLCELENRALTVLEHLKKPIYTVFHLWVGKCQSTNRQFLGLLLCQCPHKVSKLIHQTYEVHTLKLNKMKYLMQISYKQKKQQFVFIKHHCLLNKYQHSLLQGVFLKSLLIRKRSDQFKEDLDL